MSYAKIDDLLPHHDKVVDAGRDAPAVFGLYVASICYAQRQKTDGHIPRRAVSMLLPGCPRPHPRLLEALVRLRLWDTEGDGWRIHDYLEHNPSAAERKAKATKASDARWHAQPIPSRMLDACSTDASSSPTPLLSSPLLSTPKVKPSESGLGATTMPDGFSANRPDTAKTAATRYPTTEAEYLASRGGKP